MNMRKEGKQSESQGRLTTGRPVERLLTPVLSKTGLGGSLGKPRIVELWAVHRGESYRERALRRFTKRRGLDIQSSIVHGNCLRLGKTYPKRQQNHLEHTQCWEVELAFESQIESFLVQGAQIRMPRRGLG